MITIVDHNKTHSVQKVTKPDGKLVRYQVAPIPAGDTEAVKVFMTLEMARAAIGKTNGGRMVN